MSVTAAITAGLELANVTMKFIDSERRKSFQKQYDKLIKERDEVYNRQGDDWFDSDVDAFNLRSVRFLQAYSAEIRKSNMANLQSEV